MSGIEAFIAELDRKAISFGNQYDEEHENEHYYEDRLYELKREGARQGLDALWQVEDMRKKQKRKREKRKYIYRKLKGLGDASEFQVRYGSNGIFINQSNERSFQIIVQDDVDLLQSRQQPLALPQPSPGLQMPSTGPSTPLQTEQNTQEKILSRRNFSIRISNSQQSSAAGRATTGQRSGDGLLKNPDDISDGTSNDTDTDHDQEQAEILSEGSLTGSILMANVPSHECVFPYQSDIPIAIHFYVLRCGFCAKKTWTQSSDTTGDLFRKHLTSHTQSRSERQRIQRLSLRKLLKAYGTKVEDATSEWFCRHVANLRPSKKSRERHAIASSEERTIVVATDEAPAEEGAVDEEDSEDPDDDSKDGDFNPKTDEDSEDTNEDSTDRNYNLKTTHRDGSRNNKQRRTSRGSGNPSRLLKQKNTTRRSSTTSKDLKDSTAYSDTKTPPSQRPNLKRYRADTSPKSREGRDEKRRSLPSAEQSVDDERELGSQVSSVDGISGQQQVLEAASASPSLFV